MGLTISVQKQPILSPKKAKKSQKKTTQIVPNMEFQKRKKLTFLA